MILLWQNRRFLTETGLRIGLLGAGTIARLVLENLRQGEIAGVRAVALASRNGSGRAAGLASEFGIPLVLSHEALMVERKSLRTRFLRETHIHDPRLGPQRRELASPVRRGT